MPPGDRALRRLGLGTAQFGTHYGISNDRGKPGETEVAKLIEAAEEAGVGYLDTAPGYHDAETLVGRYLSPDHSIRIVTKTPPTQTPEIGREHKKDILEGVLRSLDRLKASRIHGLLVHHPADLAKTGWQWLVEAMQEARSRGLVDRLGVSVYSGDQLELAEIRLTIGIAQIPFNILDPRLADSDSVRRLKAAGAEIHARSVFLQGLLLMTPSILPEFFHPIRKQLSLLHASWDAAGLRPAAACLHHVMQNEIVDAAIVGFNGLTEFLEIQQILLNVPVVGPYAHGSPIEAQFLDPSRWPAFKP